MRSEATKRAQKAYVKSRRRFYFEASRKSEADLIRFVEGKGNIQAYVKELIRKDMEA